MLKRLAALLALTIAAPSLRAQGQQVVETEPNNTAATADAITLGDVATGNVQTDNDFFVLDLTAGTKLDLDVDATVNGCTLDAHLKLFSSDGQTLVAENQNSQFDGSPDSRLQYVVPNSGRYFVEISADIYPTGTNPCYSMKTGTFSEPAAGPGEPTTTFASGFVYPSGMIAGPAGDLYLVNDPCCGPESDPNGKILRITASGAVSTFASGLWLTGGIALDEFGNILVTGFDGGVGSGKGVIWRFSASGQRSVFASGFSWPFALVAGPDGDIWMSEQGFPTLRRYSSTGTLESQQQANAIIDHMAFSPAGELHYMAGTALYRLSSGDAVWHKPAGWNYKTGLAFDRDGYIYVGHIRHISNDINGEIVLLNPQYQVVHDPFVYVNRTSDNSASPVFPVFLTDANGDMTNRLVSTSSAKIVEVNRSGVRAPGWPVGKRAPAEPDPVVVTVNDIANALMGGSALTAEQVQYLDNLGNKNGRLDVGDLRAYLRSQGLLVGSTHP
jgi:hypothetical protein